MKYLLDKNILTNNLIENIDKRDDLCVMQEVLDEAGITGSDIVKVRKAGIHVLKVEKKHLEKLIEFMTTNGNNLKLINLYTGKGTADVVMIAYILSERDDPRTLFVEEYTIVTRDKELIAIAEVYGINCISNLK